MCILLRPRRFTHGALREFCWYITQLSSYVHMSEQKYYSNTSSYRWDTGCQGVNTLPAAAPRVYIMYIVTGNCCPTEKYKHRYERCHRNQGHVFDIKTAFRGIWISIIKIRRSHDRLIFMIGIHIQIRLHLYIEITFRVLYCIDKSLVGVAWYICWCPEMGICTPKKCM